jgi:2-iminobutanoate/2-iminopropanoate deaminase
MLRPFNPADMAQPASRYSQGVEVSPGARWLHVSGQVGVGADGVAKAGLAAQMEQCFANVGTVLTGAGMAKSDLVKMTVLVTVAGVEALGIYRRVRDQWIDGHAPAMTYLVVAGLASPDFLVEIEAVAAK